MILDLKRPERFYTILLRPQWRSWLTIGAYILVVYGALLGLSFLAALFGATSFRHFLLWPGGLGRDTRVDLYRLPVWAGQGA